MKMTNSSLIKPYTSKELAVLYGISTLVLRNWLRMHQAVIGPKMGHYFTSLQVKIIFERLGEP